MVKSFNTDAGTLRGILAQYGIFSEITYINELLRYDHDSEGPESKEIRLVISAGFNERPHVVVKITNERAHPA